MNKSFPSSYIWNHKSGWKSVSKRLFLVVRMVKSSRLFSSLTSLCLCLRLQSISDWPLVEEKDHGGCRSQTPPVSIWMIIVRKCCRGPRCSSFLRNSQGFPLCSRSGQKRHIHGSETDKVIYKQIFFCFSSIGDVVTHSVSQYFLFQRPQKTLQSFRRPMWPRPSQWPRPRH